MSDRKRGRKAQARVTVEELQGFAFFQRLRGLLDGLHESAAHRNRKLYFDEYAMAVLFYFFNPAITSLRGLQLATGFEKVQKALGLRRMSLGSMSESVRVFDPELLEAVFEDLAESAVERATDPRLKDLRQVLTVVDGTILPALPRMAWAVWMGKRGQGVKAHVQFEVLKGAAVDVALTPGTGSEIEELKKRLQPGRLYVVDRGYRDAELFAQIVAADSSFVARVAENSVYEVLEEYEVTTEGMKAAVASDRLVRLGCAATRRKFDQPVRLIEVRVPERPPRGLGYPVKRVASKKMFREPVGKAHTLWLVTDRLDLPADVIALIYLHRWKVELFFRLLKSVFNCRHLLSDSYEGVSVQVYAALLATLLLAEYTGVAASKKTLLLVTLYLQGWASRDELMREIEKTRIEGLRKRS